MKVIFLKDFGGRETGERRFAKGQVLEVDSVNVDWIERGIYELVPELHPLPGNPDYTEKEFKAFEAKVKTVIKKHEANLPYADLKKHQVKSEPVVITKRARRK